MNLNFDKDFSLVQEIKLNNCNDSFVKLSAKYDNFYFSIAKKYSSILIKMGMSQNDIKYEKDFILFKAINSYNPDHKSKFSTWFCNCARYHFLNFINSSKKYVLAEDNQIDFFNNNHLISTDKNHDTQDYLESLISGMKDSRVKMVYRLRYFSGGEKLATWHSIAKKLNISTQTAINLHEKARVFLKKKLESKNSFDLV